MDTRKLALSTSESFRARLVQFERDEEKLILNLVKPSHYVQHILHDGLYAGMPMIPYPYVAGVPVQPDPDISRGNVAFYAMCYTPNLPPWDVDMDAFLIPPGRYHMSALDDFTTALGIPFLVDTDSGFGSSTPNPYTNLRFKKSEIGGVRNENWTIPPNTQLMIGDTDQGSQVQFSSAANTKHGYLTALGDVLIAIVQNNYGGVNSLAYTIDSDDNGLHFYQTTGGFDYPDGLWSALYFDAQEVEMPVPGNNTVHALIIEKI